MFQNPKKPPSLPALAAILALALTAAACRNDDAANPSPTPTGVATAPTVPPTGSALPSIPPTGSPGVTGNLTIGTATVTVTGAVNVSATYDELATPGIWTPPPGAIALNWTGTGAQSLGITGASFTAQQPTAPDRVLQFSVRAPSGVVTFRSTNGECLVTISPALPDQMGGTFLCTGIPSEDGSFIVNAQGSFNAG
jgi:hypothetical protein